MHLTELNYLRYLKKDKQLQDKLSGIVFAKQY